MAELPVRDLETTSNLRSNKVLNDTVRSTEEEGREILRNSVWNDTHSKDPLGKRLRALFGEIGLEEDIPEWHSHPAELATF